VTDQLLTIDVHNEQGAVTLVLSGELDMASAGTLRACLETLDQGARRVVLDLSGVTFIDSSGLGLLARTRERFGPELRELTLRAPSKAVRAVLAISGLDQVIPVVEGGIDRLQTEPS